MSEVLHARGEPDYRVEIKPDGHGLLVGPDGDVVPLGPDDYGRVGQLLIQAHCSATRVQLRRDAR